MAFTISLHLTGPGAAHECGEEDGGDDEVLPSMKGIAVDALSIVPLSIAAGGKT